MAATETTKKKTRTKKDGDTAIHVPLAEAIELDRNGNAVPGGGHVQSHVSLNLTVKQRIGLHRLTRGLSHQEALVSMPAAKGRKAVTSGAEAIRWVLERAAEAGI